MRFSKKQAYSLCGALLISLILVWLLLRQIENKTIVETLLRLSPSLALFAFALYVLISLSRAWRFNSLLLKPVPMRKMFTIMCLHNAINLAMPARSGELSYPYLLKKQNVPYAESLSSLIAARLFDLVSIFVLFIAMLPFVGPLPAFTENMFYAFLGVLMLLFLVIIALVLWKLEVKHWVETVRRWTGTHKNALLTRLQRLGGNTLDALRRYGNRRVLGRLAAHSLFQWALMFSFSYIVLRALGMEVTLPQSFIGSSLSMLVLVIPFQGLLGFGTTEAVWVIMFMALGFPKEQLIAMAFAAHIVVLLFSAVMGIYGIATIPMLKNSRSAPRLRRTSRRAG